MSESKKDELSLDVLLQLDSEIFPMDCGYWTKIEAKRVVTNEHIPHGIKYSLTLHNPSNVRILGYDNAHAIKPKRKKYGAKRESGIIDTKEKLLNLMSSKMQLNC